MAATSHVIEGKVKWAKVFEQNRDLEGYMGSAKEHGGMYSINVYLDKDNKAKFKASKSQKKIYDDDDGDYVVLTRKHVDKFDWASGQPTVVKKNSVAWSLEDDGFIGNGSVCRIKFTTYETMKGMGTRLDAIKVLEHVPFVTDGPGVDEFTPKPREGKSDYDDQVSSDEAEELEDSIPF